MRRCEGELLAGTAAATSGMDPAEATPPARSTKTGQVLALLRRAKGATLAELVEATCWLPHTTRAALTCPRTKGHMLDKTKRGKATCYSIADAA